MRTLMQLTVPGTSSAGRVRFTAVTRHVGHLAVEPGAQPVEKMRLVARQIDVSDAEPRKAELRGSSAEVGQTGRLGSSRQRVTVSRKVEAINGSRAVRCGTGCRHNADTDAQPHRLDLSRACPDSSATEALGQALARALPAAAAAGAVVYLQGELGAGKTTCVRSLLRALGVDGLVRSPTYTLVETYRLAALTCIHVDLYRLQVPDTKSMSWDCAIWWGRAACCWWNGPRKAAARCRPRIWI